MNSYPAHRGGRPTSAPTTHHAPNAALLIDFDNVTLGVRSDLTKELRSLLNSEIIKGKVAVQRAYADWRRYPQYIVPLSESSIDLIFAPAFGTNKKNATDIRLAVDAIELVFTRPEIGTFILLSGDSDFSSLVLKLKEYGKYVIGVGIRESASDILIQNCDEYYSYSDLAGLTKESDAPSAQRDPWELVTDAVQRMQQNGDVMRADRLKQVMQQLDDNFDEKNVGLNRFSKFVTEAANRGLLVITKQANGQMEVAPPTGKPAKGGAPKGGSASAPSRGAAPSQPAAATPAPAAETKGEREERGGRRRRGRGRGRGKGEEGGAAPTPAATIAEPTGLTLAEAFHLLSRALGELPAPVAAETLRARMSALHGKEDELLDTARFGKLLRQANDAEVADVRQLGEDRYEVSPHKADLALQMRAPVESAPAADGAATTVTAPAARQPNALRFRGGSKQLARPSGLQMVGVIDLSPTPAPAPTPEPEAAAPAAPVEAKAAKSAKGAKGAKRGGRGGDAKKAPAQAELLPAATVVNDAPGVAKAAKKAKSAKPAAPKAKKAPAKKGKSAS